VVNRYPTNVIFGKPVIGYASRDSAIAVKNHLGGIVYRADTNLFQYRKGQWLAKTDRIPVTHDVHVDATTTTTSAFFRK